MAYQDQIKCWICGIPIPPQPEDATLDMLLCDTCYEEWERKLEEASRLAQKEPKRP